MPSRVCSTADLLQRARVGLLADVEHAADLAAEDGVAEPGGGIGTGGRVIARQQRQLADLLLDGHRGQQILDPLGVGGARPRRGWRRSQDRWRAPRRSRRAVAATRGHTAARQMDNAMPIRRLDPLTGGRRQGCGTSREPRRLGHEPAPRPVGAGNRRTRCRARSDCAGRGPSARARTRRPMRRRTSSPAPDSTPWSPGVIQATRAASALHFGDVHRAQRRERLVRREPVVEAHIQHRFAMIDGAEPQHRGPATRELEPETPGSRARRRSRSARRRDGCRPRPGRPETSCHRHSRPGDPEAAAAPASSRPADRRRAPPARPASLAIQSCTRSKPCSTRSPTRNGTGFACQIVSWV